MQFRALEDEDNRDFLTLGAPSLHNEALHLSNECSPQLGQSGGWISIPVTPLCWVPLRTRKPSPVYWGPSKRTHWMMSLMGMLSRRSSRVFTSTVQQVRA